MIDELIYREMAKELMSTIAHCNGAVDRWHPMKYPEKYVKLIAPACKKFFDNNPELWNDNGILNICDGEIEENKKLYGNLVGYKELDEVLNEYFNQI